MAVIETKEIPFRYTEVSPDGRSGQVDINLVAEFDTELKRTFVYRNNKIGGITTGRTLLGTINAGENNIVPFQDSNGQFNFSNSLRSELVNNQQLKQNINNSVENSAKQFLSIDGAFDPSSISQQELDNFLGTNNAATTGSPDQPAPPGTTNPGASENSPAAGAQSTGEIPIPVITARTGTNDPNQFKSSVGGGELRYPLNAGDDSDYIKFETYEYKPKTLGKPLNSPVGDNLGAPLGSVILPIQSQISDNNTVGWGDGKVNAVELEVFKLARSGISGGISGFTKDVSSVMDELIKNKTYGDAFSFYAAAQAAQVNGLFSRATGGILNPNLELLFEGPELRSFNFQFQLSARSKDEATRIREIIKFFKVSMSVQRSNTDLFLKSPNVFKINYIKGTGDHKSLNRFKTCALRSFNVDYTPLGSYMTYDDPAGTMVSYGLSMQFQEIDPIYNDDYNGFTDEIGY